LRARGGEAVPEFGGWGSPNVSPQGDGTTKHPAEQNSRKTAILRVSDSPEGIIPLG